MPGTDLGLCATGSRLIHPTMHPLRHVLYWPSVLWYATPCPVLTQRMVLPGMCRYAIGVGTLKVKFPYRPTHAQCDVRY
eukprot:2832773-Rhodomonas_salina.1